MPTNTPKTIIIIPARMAAGRFPGKPMAMAGGKPLVHWTYDQAKKTKADHVIVATPDREIGRYCQDNGLMWRPTRSDHPTGTHRCAEVLQQIKADAKIEYVINLQVDEPLVDPADIDRMVNNSRILACGINTLVVDVDENNGVVLNDPNQTKVVVNGRSEAMWFSRAPMRGSKLHCGVYLFAAHTLRYLAELSTTKLGQAESLEQLTWLEDQRRIYTTRIEKLPLSINTPEDFEKFKQIVEKNE